MINSASGSVSTSCTAGFLATGGGYNWLLTAGHCTRVGASVYQANVDLVGSVDRVDLTDTDALRIKITKTSSWISNDIVLSSGVYRDVTSAQTPTQDATGQTSCITGINFSGARCGSIKNNSYDATYKTAWGDQVTWRWGREVDADCNPGDSGGPAFYGNQARGLIAIKVTRTLGNDTCVYTHIGDIVSQLGLTGVRTS